jgi:hypothetical protein
VVCVFIMINVLFLYISYKNILKNTNCILSQQPYYSETVILFLSWIENPINLSLFSVSLQDSFFVFTSSVKNMWGSVDILFVFCILVVGRECNLYFSEYSCKIYIKIEHLSLWRHKPLFCNQLYYADMYKKQKKNLVDLLKTS